MQKSNWLSAYDALPQHLLEIALLKNQQLVAGVVRVFADVVDVRAANDCFFGSGSALGEEVGGGGHLGGLGRQRWGVCVVDQFRPDQMPVVRSEVPAHKLATARHFDPGAVFNRDGFAPVVDGLRRYSIRSRELCLEAIAALEQDAPLRPIWKTHACSLFSPTACVKIDKPQEPFVFVTFEGRADTALDKDVFTPCGLVDALFNVVLKQFYSHAADTISVRGDASNRVNRAPYLDVPVAEMADVEKLHGSSPFDLALGKNRLEAFPERVARLGGDPASEFTDSCLTAAALLGNFGLGKTVFFLNVRDEFFPIHTSHHNGYPLYCKRFFAIGYP